MITDEQKRQNHKITMNLLDPSQRKFQDEEEVRLFELYKETMAKLHWDAKGEPSDEDTIIVLGEHLKDFGAERRANYEAWNTVLEAKIAELHEVVLSLQEHQPDIRGIELEQYPAG